MHDFETLRKKAQDFAENLRSAEKSLIELLMPIERTKGYLALGYSSLYAFCLGDLKLSDYQSCNFIAIARQSEAVPAFRAAVESGAVSITNAGKIAPILQPGNQSDWIAKAAELSKRELEREIKTAFPERAVRDSIRPIAADRSELKLGMATRVEKKFQRARELMAKQTRSAPSHEELLEEVLDFYLKAKDPVLRAERCLARASQAPLSQTSQKARSASPPRPGRVHTATTPASVRVVRRGIPRPDQHRVFARDKDTCQFKSREGLVCGARFFTHVHHLRPWAKGGGHAAHNLLTVCSAHHRWLHREENGHVPGARGKPRGEFGALTHRPILSARGQL